jgi:hypothetical protein
MRSKMYLAVAAGVIATASASLSASAQDVNQVVRTLNAIVNPQDALRLEDRARRDGRADEERYWRDYRAGLERRRPEQEGAYVPASPGGDRRGHQIGPEEARRYEEESRRRRRFEEERYWRDYRAGLAHRPDTQRSHAIGPEEARRLEEESRRNRRFEEERYWREYRGGVGR